MIESPIELHMFSHSHYNEKVRWTLDYKGIEHVRICYIPGPHVLQIRRLSGQTETPVVRMDGRVIAGSATIIDAIEQRFPSPPLYPADATTREEALSVQAKLDADLGPELRRAVFDTILDDSACVVATFASEKASWKRSLYLAAFPLVRMVMKKQMNITAETARLSKQRVETVLDFLADKSAATGYLAGSEFSIADLTAAALLGPAALVDHPDMRQAEPLPPRFSDLCGEWARHPGMRWAREIWRKHRPARRGIVIR